MTITDTDFVVARNFIAGEATDGTESQVRSPFDDSVVGTLHQADSAVARTAVDAAAAAFPAWAKTPARERARILLRAADAIDADAGRIGAILAAEAGKRLPEAVGEVKLSAEYFRWFAEEARRPNGSVYPHEDPSRRHLSITRPAGVVISLTPWNFPCSIQARKLAPALAAGCTVVARVSEKAPLAVTEMMLLVHRAGLPDGVLNIVHGPARETTEALMGHDAVRVVSFTGSTGVGASIMSLAAQQMIRPLLELGGNAAFVVFPDADLDKAVEGAYLAKFRNAGQSCIGANRFFVHDDVYEEFTTRLVARIDAMQLGGGFPPQIADLGPLIDARRATEVQGMVDEAVQAGAKVLTRGFELPTETYCAPALVADVPATCALSTDEVFGPVAAVSRFSDDAALVEAVNSTDMGLASYFYTSDFSRAVRMAEQFDAGIVGINNALPTVVFAPMGGTKHSGIGREGSHAGLEEFTETTYLSIEL